MAGQYGVAVRHRQRSCREALARTHHAGAGPRNRGRLRSAAALGHVRRQHAGLAGARHLHRHQRRPGSGPGRRLRHPANGAGASASAQYGAQPRRARLARRP
ncbi:hypothetical protein G6F40_016768 [Rhizopus arrhizus]|nr:hypothetical protein G6F40_016768 [Rhizopus arrhizus]